MRIGTKKIMYEFWTWGLGLSFEIRGRVGSVLRAWGCHPMASAQTIQAYSGPYRHDNGPS